MSSSAAAGWQQTPIQGCKQTGPAACSAPVQAFAELNILLARCLSSGALTDNLLRSYSRFTLQPRQQLWERYSKYAADRGSLSGQQLELLRFLLGCVLDP